MAFSYSDKNFTVVGNLCFAHIKTDTSGTKSIGIPSAVADRMLIDDFNVMIITSMADLSKPGYVFARISNGKISYTAPSPNTYVYTFFPIDSNK